MKPLDLTLKYFGIKSLLSELKRNILLQVSQINAKTERGGMGGDVSRIESCHGYQLFANNVSVAANNHSRSLSLLFFDIRNQKLKKL